MSSMSSWNISCQSGVQGLPSATVIRAVCSYVDVTVIRVIICFRWCAGYVSMHFYGEVQVQCHTQARTGSKSTTCFVW